MSDESKCPDAPETCGSCVYWVDEEMGTATREHHSGECQIPGGEFIGDVTGATFACDDYEERTKEAA